MFLGIHFQDYESINILCYFKKLIDTLIYLPWNNTIEEEYTILVSHKKVDVRNISACVHVFVSVCLCICAYVYIQIHTNTIYIYMYVYLWGDIYMHIYIWYNMQKGKNIPESHTERNVFSSKLRTLSTDSLVNPTLIIFRTNIIFKDKFWRFNCHCSLLLQWLHTSWLYFIFPLFEQTYLEKSLKQAWYIMLNCNIKDFMQVLLYLHNGFSLNWLQKHLLPRASIIAKYNVPH